MFPAGDPWVEIVPFGPGSLCRRVDQDRTLPAPLRFGWYLDWDDVWFDVVENPDGSTSMTCVQWDSPSHISFLALAADGTKLLDLNSSNHKGQKLQFTGAVERTSYGMNSQAAKLITDSHKVLMLD